MRCVIFLVNLWLSCAYVCVFCKLLFLRFQNSWVAVYSISELLLCVILLVWCCCCCCYFVIDIFIRFINEKGYNCISLHMCSKMHALYMTHDLKWCHKHTWINCQSFHDVAFCLDPCLLMHTGKRERKRESSLMSLIDASFTIKCLPDKCLFLMAAKPAATPPTKLWVDRVTAVHWSKWFFFKSKQIDYQPHLQVNLWVANFQHSFFFLEMLVSTKYPHSALMTAAFAVPSCNFFFSKFCLQRRHIHYPVTKVCHENELLARVHTQAYPKIFITRACASMDEWSLLFVCVHM